MAKPGPERDLDAKRRILDATRGLIAEQGPNRVGVDEIVARAGVGKQTIYRWWSSKAAVVLDALEESFEIERAFPDTGSTRRDLRIQMRRVATAFASPTGAIIQQAVSRSQGDPDVAEEFRRRFFDRRRGHAAAVIERGIARGELRGDLPVETAVDVLYAPLWLRLLVGHQPLTAAAADDILDLVWPALAGD